MKPPTFFTLPELASMAGVTRKRMLSILVTNGVEPKRSGRRLVVFLYQLKTGFPELWYSLQERMSR